MIKEGDGLKWKL
jgi:hypothetical protein